MELARASVPLTPPASPPPTSPLTISIPARIPAPAVVSTAAALDPAVATKRLQEPEVSLQQLEYDEDGEDTPPIEHYTYTYQDPNKVAMQTQVSEPESPSPILAAWPPTQLNPDYLAPYHPSLHKNIHNWSQILLDQVRQKGGAPLSADHTQHSVGDAVLEGETAESGATFQGVSVATSTSSARDDAIKVEKHFLFQTHHRQPHSKHGPHSSKPHPIRPRHQIHARRASERSTRTFRSLVHFLQRLLHALKRRSPSPVQEEDAKLKEEDAKLKEANPSSSTPPSPRPPPSSSFAEPSSSAEPSDGSLQYLSVSENGASGDQESSRSNTCFTQASGPEPQNSPQPKKSITNTATSAVSSGFKAIKDVPKMMKFLDKIKSHAHRHHAEEASHPVSQKQAAAQQGPKANAAPTTPKMSPAALATAAQFEAMAEQKREERARGPRMHPKLLELYEVTDRVLGVGTFATVKEIKLKSTGQSFALKIILKKTLQGKGSMLDTEIAVLSKVRHPNCVSLLEMFETEDAVYLVTDLAAGGELFDQLLKKGYYTEGDAARLVREILLGVEYLHAMGIVHRDLKPENLLFHDKTEDSRLMITDFGLSKVLTSGNDVLMTACGTPGYVAPEVLEEIGHGKPVDMWSVGVIAYTLLCGYTPFWGEDQPALFENIIAGEYQYEEEYWKDISPLAKSFIDSLLVTQASRRPTATQALSHPWFRAMLDQNLAAPASPADSVNLLPAMRKNFNARNVFKKAVRAVGILRRMQGSSPTSPTSSPDSNSESLPRGADVTCADGIVVTEGKTPLHHGGLSFHDVVNAAVMTNQGVRLDPVTAHVAPDVASASVDTAEVADDSNEYLNRVDAALEVLTVQGGSQEGIMTAR
ncbi:hypothetical protein BGZ70_005527 [Mortierella alpina]|uniref:Protein kinase domain-containing protein n=1 Tax=Mortierella alpina TaxID=64518 RepID=A0A9P6M3J9_MORAP|nr:hypothetical protein BGZ70_005527 [Mortierella alpina]